MNRSGFITLEEAVERLGVESSASIINGKKYQQFYHPVKGKRGAPTFDINGYMKYEATKENVVSKVQLFVEYLNKERMMSYTFIAKRAGLETANRISNLTFGYFTALQIANALYYLIPSFDEYYGWSRS